jgi:SPP1 family phage portal protein
LQAVLYEEDGYTKFAADDANTALHQVGEKQTYKQTVAYTEADPHAEVIGGENYGALPIVPLWGNRLHQSTLVGMRESIDAYDLAKSGFADDMHDCAEIYWIVSGAAGSDDDDLKRFRDRLLFNHIAPIDGDAGQTATPYTQEPPYNARREFLAEIRSGIYEDFGGLDVHTIAAGATNDHIDAAYQPLDENADDFEYQVTKCIEQLLALLGLKDTPIYTRNRISNQAEQVQVVMQEAPYLDQETILRKLPNVRPEEVPEILARVDNETLAKFGA